MILNHSDLQAPWVLNEQWQRMADTLVQSLEEQGYAVVQLLPNEAGALGAAFDELCGARGILSQALDRRQRLQVCRTNLDCGYSDLGHKQSFTYRSGRRWVPDELTASERNAFEAAMAAGHAVCLSVLGCICGSSNMRLPPLSLQSIAENVPLEPKRWSASLLQAFNYAPADTAAAAPALPLAGPCAAHEDLLTLVYAPGQPGLQVRDCRKQWKAAPVLLEDEVLVMAGHTLEHALCSLLPATQHSVAAQAGEPPRRSLTFKMRPAPGTRIDLAAALMPALEAAGREGQVGRYPAMTGRELMQRFSATHDSVNAPPVRATPARAAPSITAAVATGAGTAAAAVATAAAPADTAEQSQQQRFKRPRLEDAQPEAAAAAAAAPAGDVAGPAADGSGLAGPSCSMPPSRAAAAAAIGAAGIAGSPRVTRLEKRRLSSGGQVNANGAIAANPGQEASSNLAAAVPAIQLSLHNVLEGSITVIKVKPDTAFDKVVGAYCTRMGLSPEDVNFTTPEGVRLRWTCGKTVAELELEDGDEVLVFMVQIGD